MDKYAPKYAPETRQVPRPTNLTNKKPTIVHGKRKDLPNGRWPSGVTITFLHRIDQIRQFQQQTGRLPREDDPNGRWLRERRTVGVTAAQGRVLDEELPGWRNRPKRARAQSFEAHLKGLRRFVAEFGALPSQHEPHGIFLSNCRAGAIVLTPARIAALDEIHPNWRHERRRRTLGDLEFAEHVRQVKEFRLRNDRFPAPSEPSGTWLVELRGSAWVGERLSAEERETLDRELPGWDIKRTIRPRQSFEEHVYAVERFRAANGRFPYRSEPHGVWFSQVRRYLIITPERQQLLDEHIPGWADQLPRSRGKHVRPNYRKAA